MMCNLSDENPSLWLHQNYTHYLERQDSALWKSKYVILDDYPFWYFFEETKVEEWDWKINWNEIERYLADILQSEKKRIVMV